MTRAMRCHWYHALVLLVTTVCSPSATAFEIRVDYTYDTQGFFNTPAKRLAIEAAADRYSRIITSPLTEVEPTDWRIGFTHPGTGAQFQVTTAIDRGSDPISSVPADEYGFPGLKANEWVLFVGGHSIDSAGLGGTGTGVNFTSVFADLDGPMRRGVISETPSMSERDLPAWGGAVTFDNRRDWHFGLDTIPAPGVLDFYSIALHEIGHALGLNGSWNQWQQYISGGQFEGEHAVTAYNQDNGTTLDALTLQSTFDPHWQDGTYQAHVFSGGADLLPAGTATGRQDLLLEPIANFTIALRRFDLTSVDVAALVDVGWSVISPLDRNADERIDGLDLNSACGSQVDLATFFAELQTLAGDLDLNGSVDFADFLIFSNHFDASGSYTDGDLDCDGVVQFGDFLVLSRNFNQTAIAAAVPEPSTWQLAMLVSLGVIARRVRPCCS